MAAPGELGSAALRSLERLGRGSARGLEFLGQGASLVSQSLYWLLLGRRHQQRVQAAPVFREMMEMGIRAIPIVSLLSATVGVMLALQGIYQLRRFGLESQVILGVAFGMTREFAPLITGILVAGRSGSALAARLGTMTISQEVDALRVMGINPVRFLVVPSMLAMLIMLPSLVVWADLVSIWAAGLYVTSELGMTMGAYVGETLDLLTSEDVLHGLYKSLIFAVLVTVVGIVNGSRVTGGAEGVGRATTDAVVHGITAIILTDMLFVFATTRG
jgi:phospholipid/cholesterol/gamma-HCH transport system permease protein